MDEDETSEFIGIINYCAMALIQMEKGVANQPDMTADEAVQLYDEKIAKQSFNGK